MSFDIDDLNQAARKTRSNLPATENIPVQISSYDLSNPDRHMAVGTRLDTGEEIKVYLLPDKDAAKRDFARAEIADFAAGPRDHKASTDIGGTILFERAYEGNKEPGIHASRWATVMSHTAEEARVLVGMVRALPPVNGQNGTKQAVEMLHNADAKMAVGYAQLQQSLMQVFAAQTPGVPGAYLRIEGTKKDGTPSVAAFKVSSTFTEDQNTGTITRDEPGVAFQKFADSSFGKALLSKLEQSPNQPVEVIPATTYSVGRDTVKQAGDSMASRFKVKDGDGYGFAESSLAVRQRKTNGSYYAAEAFPLRNDRLFYTVENIPTPNREGTPALIDTVENTTGEIEFDGADVGMNHGQSNELSGLDQAAQRQRRPGR